MLKNILHKLLSYADMLFDSILKAMMITWVSVVMGSLFFEVAYVTHDGSSKVTMISIKWKE